MLIVSAIKDLEREGQDSAPQSDIINRVVTKVVREEDSGTSIEKAQETAKKIANCINHLITKENILMITQDSKVKNERLLCLNINLDITSMNLAGQQ